MVVLGFWIGFMFSPLPLLAGEGPPLHLRSGEQRLLHFPGLRRYSASGEAFRIAPLPRDLDPHARSESLLLKASQPGIGELWVWSLDGSVQHRSIHVTRPDVSRPAALDLALSRLEEVDVVSTGGTTGGARTWLQGQVRTQAECLRIRALKQSFPQHVVDETLPTPELLERGRTALESWRASTPAAAKLRIEMIAQGLQIRGSITRAHDRDQIERQAAARFACAQQILTSPPDESPTIAFRVYLLEVKRDRMSSLGLQWPAGQAAAFRVSPWGIARNIALDVAIQTLEGEGAVQVLSSPELVVRAPGEAELFAGGEIPIRATSQYSSQVSWRPYGLLFKLTVGIASEERVRVDIHTEVSHLAAPIGDESLPGVQANRMKTQVDARYGEPLLLSGLLRRETREQARGLPGLRRLPVLGALFGSRDYLEDRSELVAILVPSAAPPPLPKPDHAEPGAFVPSTAPAPPPASLPETHPTRTPRLHRWFAS